MKANDQFLNFYPRQVLPRSSPGRIQSKLLWGGYEQWRCDLQASSDNPYALQPTVLSQQMKGRRVAAIQKLVQISDHDLVEKGRCVKLLSRFENSQITLLTTLLTKRERNLSNLFSLGISRLHKWQSRAFNIALKLALSQDISTLTGRKSQKLPFPLPEFARVPS